MSWGRLKLFRDVFTNQFKFDTSPITPAGSLRDSFLLCISNVVQFDVLL